MIRNSDVHRTDYNALRDTPRPSHADYAGHKRYGGYEDPSGGGHFSGRLTAVYVAAGAIAESMLARRGIRIGTHIELLGGIRDIPFDEEHLAEQIADLHAKDPAVLSEEAGAAMLQKIEECRREQDSLGAVVDTAVTGIPAGTGEPLFDTLEGRIAQAVFAVPGIKGIEFGAGFALAQMTGSMANDPFIVRDGTIRTLTNHSGGINGGIANGMPVRFRSVIRPTPSIGKPQTTVRYSTLEETQVTVTGRHDPCIARRVCPVINAVTALTIADLLIEANGRAYFTEEP